MNNHSEVVIIGSGFGASVAALRLAEAGKKVTILERGGRISRENFEADAHMFWHPKSGRYGMNEFKKRGRHIIPWLGTGVGGGSHVYAGTLKRRDFFDDFPDGITTEEMKPYYELGEKMLDAVKYPDYPPYNQLPSYCIFRKAEKQLKAERPDIVEAQGDILLGISYAPKGEEPGSTFINRHGAQQRFSDPGEQKILGGEIEVKNTLDKNYLFLAEKHGTVIHEFKEAYKIENKNGGGYTIFYKDPRENHNKLGEISCDILICGAGTIGSTELLLKSKQQYKSLPHLSDKLGKGYHTNGDFVTFLIPKKGLLLSWIGLIVGIVGLCLSSYLIASLGLMAYIIGWIRSDEKSQPDKGTTNSDYIRFKHRDGTTQGAYLEGGRYPTLVKASIAIIISLTGDFNPKDYKPISDTVNWMGKYIPIFELIERSWPIPILMMGRDDAIGEFYLDENHEAKINYPIDDNSEYIAYLNKLGKMFAKKAHSFYLPNSIAKWFKIIEVPHNIGGVSMGTSSEDGVVDTYGRVFGYKNFMVLDGSILPNSLGPNPVSTILAFSERGIKRAIQQFNEQGEIGTE